MRTVVHDTEHIELLFTLANQGRKQMCHQSLTHGTRLPTVSSNYTGFNDSRDDWFASKHCRWDRQATDENIEWWS